MHWSMPPALYFLTRWKATSERRVPKIVVIGQMMDETLPIVFSCQFHRKCSYLEAWKWVGSFGKMWRKQSNRLLQVSEGVTCHAESPTTKRWLDMVILLRESRGQVPPDVNSTCAQHPCIGTMVASSCKVSPRSLSPRRKSGIDERNPCISPGRCKGCPRG